MELFLSVLSLMAHVFWSSVLSPLFVILYILLFILVSWQYKRIERISSSIIRTKRKTYIKSALLATFLGLFGGLLGSILIVFIGIDLQSVGIFPLWIIAIVLMLFSPRYLCFAYAGGILALISLIFGYPKISIPQLMGLVAILHIIESILIVLNGHFNAMPVYVKQGDEIRGGFNLQKFWPIPLIALISAGVSDPNTGVMMPEWWPLLKDYGGFAEGRTYTLLPVLAVLGYGEISTTSAPCKKAYKSAIHLFVFSMALLGFSVLASFWDIFLPVVALFSPLGHELVIWLGMKEESNKTPLYVDPPQGVGILDIENNSLAAKAGLRPGDIILKVNGELVNRKNDFIAQVIRANRLVQFEVLRNKKIDILTVNKDPDDEIGIIFVPDSFTKKYLTIKEGSFFDVFARLKR